MPRAAPGNNTRQARPAGESTRRYRKRSDRPGSILQALPSARVQAATTPARQSRSRRNQAQSLHQDAAKDVARRSAKRYPRANLACARRHDEGHDMQANGREQKRDQAEDAKEPHAKSAHGGFRAGGIPQRAHLDECPGLDRTDHAPHFAQQRRRRPGGPNVNDQWSELGGDMDCVYAE